MSEKFTFFWHGPLSQWHPSNFEVDGVFYNCAEQYMMAEKARLFKDNQTLAKIMSASHPREQKKLGRQVSNFDLNFWNKSNRAIVFRGNMAKFTQNPVLKEKLLATAGTTLVEASPYDKIWGIGLKADDPRVNKRSTWQGQNLLGEILTEVRDTIMEEEQMT